MADEWLRTATLREGVVVLDDFVVMPDHLHALLYLHAHDDGNRRRPSLGEVIGGFKAAVTSRCRQSSGAADLRVWQRNYYEHIVRSARAVDLVREYIRSNPECWPAEPVLRLPAEELGPAGRDAEHFE